MEFLEIKFLKQQCNKKTENPLCLAVKWLLVDENPAVKIELTVVYKHPLQLISI